MGKKKNKPKKISLQENKDFNKIIKNLDIVQYMAVCSFIENEVKRKTEDADKQLKAITSAVDRNLTAALILKTEFSLEEINSILGYAVTLIEEDNKKVIKLKEEGDGDWMKAADKRLENVKKRAMELIKEKTNQKTSVEILVGEFPMLSKSMVTNAYKRIKEEMSKEDEEAKKLYDAIYGTDTKKTNGEINETNDEKTKIKVEEIKTEEVVNRLGESKLEILNKKVILDIKGELGVYHIEDNKLSIDETIFNSPEEVEKVYRKQIAELKKCRDEALEVYKLAGAN